jgi:sulfatase maturation enzyme AslB (radical SAM superfamily)
MYHNAEIAHWMRHQDTHAIIPAHADIDLTNVCNQDCYYCNSAEFRASVPVQKKFDVYIKLLDQLADWRAYKPKSYGTLHSISYPGGGEPTILPGYEKVLEHTIDLGFMCSITTNGSRLENLIENVHVDKIRLMAWVGIDIDAGNEETYEKIRRSLTRVSLFDKVIRNARELVNLGAKVDFKVLLGEENSTTEELTSIFETSKKVGVRMVYFRPMIVNNMVFPFTESILKDIQELGTKYQVQYKINTSKSLERTYNRCHQMFQFPVFAADGNVYLCCENRGNPRFCLGSWEETDVRDLWLSERHFQIYNKINTKLCAPCRPNLNNIQIQKILDDPSLLENLYV